MTTMLMKLRNRSGQALTFNYKGRMLHLPPGAGAVMRQDDIAPEVQMLLNQGILEGASMAPPQTAGSMRPETPVETFAADAGVSGPAHAGRQEMVAPREPERTKHDKSGKGKER